MKTIADVFVMGLTYYVAACIVEFTIAEWGWMRRRLGRRHCEGCQCRRARLQPTWELVGKKPSHDKPFPIQIPKRELERWGHEHRN